MSVSFDVIYMSVNSLKVMNDLFKLTVFSCLSAPGKQSKHIDNSCCTNGVFIFKCFFSHQFTEPQKGNGDGKNIR